MCCVDRFVPLVKTPGQHNSAILMAKHLTLLMIKRHIETLFLVFTEGRSDNAAKLHVVTGNERQESAALKLQTIDTRVARVSGETIGQRKAKPEDG